MDKNTINEKSLKRSRDLRFLYWQIAWRKFYYDLQKDIEEYDKFKNNFYKIFDLLLSIYKTNFDVPYFIYNKFEISSEEYKTILVSKPDFIYFNFKYIIDTFHRENNDNPALDYEYNVYGNTIYLSKNFLYNIFNNYNDELSHLLSYSLKYGLYPYDLILSKDIFNSYNSYINEELPIPEPFIRPANYSDIVKINFISYKSNKCYFEEPTPKKIYLYSNYLYINIDKLIHCVNIIKKIDVMKIWKYGILLHLTFKFP